jgi:hypothetical protein
MTKATTANRAPRGTKILAQAFFAAADDIPQARRGEVVKAALAAIRDELKSAREKVAATKAKTNGMADKPRMTSPSRKAVGRPAVGVQVTRAASSASSKSRAISTKRKLKSGAVRNKAVRRAPSSVIASPAQL